MQRALQVLDRRLTMHPTDFKRQLTGKGDREVEQVPLRGDHEVLLQAVELVDGASHGGDNVRMLPFKTLDGLFVGCLVTLLRALGSPELVAGLVA